MRPTFNGSALSIETHVLDWVPAPNVEAAFRPASSPSAEGTAGLKAAATKRIEVRFWERLRDERKFTGPEELRAQIARDISAANKFFSRLRRFRSIRQPAISPTR
jgi:hypothetical protein